MIALVPIVWSWSCTNWPADWQMETRRMTAATPMTMPSTVSPARILFFANARRATRTIISVFMTISRWWVGRFRDGALYAGNHFLAFGQIAGDDLRAAPAGQSSHDLNRGDLIAVQHPDVGRLPRVGCRGVL